MVCPIAREVTLGKADGRLTVRSLEISNLEDWVL